MSVHRIAAVLLEKIEHADTMAMHVRETNSNRNRRIALANIKSTVVTSNGDVNVRQKPFNGYARYLKRLYGEPTYRVAVDGGFSCPNRGSDRSSAGCTFCDEYGSQAAYHRDGIERACTADPQTRAYWIRQQIDRGTEFLARRYGATSYLLYFQAFSSTNGPIEELRSLYNSGLATHKFRELIISTRPDCIDEERADLLAEYHRDDLPVWVELGLQSASDSTLLHINRGHTVSDFDTAVSLLKSRGIRVAAHLIFGLPGESRADMMNTIDHIVAAGVDGVKIHDLHLPKNSAMLKEFMLGETAMACSGRHLSYVIDALERLPAEAVIMRLTCDTPNHHRALPVHPLKKAVFLRQLEEEMVRRNTWQGRLHKET